MSFFDTRGLADSSEFEEMSDDNNWVQWFCSLDGHEFFAEVDEDFIRDNFNLYGLRNRVDSFDKALSMILSDSPPRDEDLEKKEFLELYRDATELYGLIHSRYILSPKGLAAMKEKYYEGDFGACPRVMCDGANMVPVGLSEDLRLHRVRVFCPACQEVYDTHNDNSDAQDIDGAFFGASFAHVFFQTFTQLLPMDIIVPYEPKVFGFKIRNVKSKIQTKMTRGFYGKDAVEEAQKFSRAQEFVLARMPHVRDLNDSSSEA